MDLLLYLSPNSIKIIENSSTPLPDIITSFYISLYHPGGEILLDVAKFRNLNMNDYTLFDITPEILDMKTLPFGIYSIKVILNGVISAHMFCMYDTNIEKDLLTLLDASEANISYEDLDYYVNGYKNIHHGVYAAYLATIIYNKFDILRKTQHDKFEYDGLNRSYEMLKRIVYGSNQ